MIVELTAGDSDESDQNNEAAGRGFRFGNLPPELRFKIYDYIVPGGLWQGYKLDELLREIRSGEPVRSRRIGKIPPLLRTSKWILDEALDSVFKRHGQIHIRNRASVVSNFPLEIILKEYSNPCREVLWEDNIQLSRCEKLSITIEQPSSPRSAEQFLQTRRVVDRVVDWLNSCSDLRPSHVQVNLVFDQQPLWNDFAILTGPLSKLKRT